MATSKTKFGVVKTILLITVLIVIVQIIAVSFISSQEGFDDRNKRDHSQIHEGDFIYEATHAPIIITTTALFALNKNIGKLFGRAEKKRKEQRDEVNITKLSDCVSWSKTRIFAAQLL